LRDALKPFEDVLILPRATENSDPSWFGFVITVRPESGISRNEFVRHLEEHRIATRPIFGGNLIHQPAYQDVQKRIAGPLTNSDIVMTNSFVIGVYPGISEDGIDYMIENCESFLNSKR
jgi:Predicted pyridoxal phosphate-dependent enzyme apparently involved in regulation of cell wall biogenesis